MPKTPTNRRFTRIDFEAKARLYSADSVWDTQLIDISLKGALCARPANWQGASGDSYRLELQLPGASGISMSATAAHISDDRIGFQWNKIDLDSFSHLKRLIELNIGDGDLLNRELSVLG